MLADPKTPAVLRPGARVSIQVDAAGPSNDPVGYRKALAEALATRLKANGMIVVEDGPPSGRSTSAVRVSYVKPSVGAGPDVRLVLRVNEKATRADASVPAVWHPARLGGRVGPPGRPDLRPEPDRLLRDGRLRHGLRRPDAAVRVRLADACGRDECGQLSEKTAMGPDQDLDDERGPALFRGTRRRRDRPPAGLH